MKVRAKFFVEDIKHSDVPGTDQYASVTMKPVFGTYGDGKVNESWSKYTPSGHLQMSITNPTAIDQFEKGRAYYIDISPVDDEAVVSVKVEPSGDLRRLACDAADRLTR